MSGSKARSKTRKSGRNSLLTRIIWGIWFLATGGGVAGLAAPNLPIVGPLIQQFSKLSPEEQRQLVEKAEGLGEQFVDLKDHLTVGTNDASIPSQPESNTASAGTVSQVSNSVRKPADTIVIASFNIQVFGNSKLGKSWVVEVLAQIVRQFDIVAIQEVRSKDDRLLPDFVAAINSDGSQYNYLIGPRLGRTVSTEQYAYVYDSTRIEVDTSSVGTIQDPRDALHREPFVARFRTRTVAPDQAFTFWLVNIHTDPDEVAAEVNVLADVFVVMQQARADEDDVILLGDLNASDRELGRLGQLPDIACAVHDTTTNTRRNKMYDNMIFDRTRTWEFTGKWGVFDVESAFHLSREQALEISDHLPIWAEFQASEVRSRVTTARLPNLLGR